MAEIKVSTQEIKDAADQIRLNNGKLEKTLDTIYTEAHKLIGNSWTSDAASEFCKKLEKFKNSHFENYKKYTNDYAVFLNNTAEQYEKTESANISEVTTDIKDSAVGQFQ